VKQIVSHKNISANVNKSNASKQLKSNDIILISLYSHYIKLLFILIFNSIIAIKEHINEEALKIRKNIKYL